MAFLALVGGIILLIGGAAAINRLTFKPALPSEVVFRFREMLEQYSTHRLGGCGTGGSGIDGGLGAPQILYYTWTHEGRLNAGNFVLTVKFDIRYEATILESLVGHTIYGRPVLVFPGVESGSYDVHVPWRHVERETVTVS